MLMASWRTLRLTLRLHVIVFFMAADVRLSPVGRSVGGVARTRQRMRCAPAAVCVSLLLLFSFAFCRVRSHAYHTAPYASLLLLLLWCGIVSRSTQHSSLPPCVFFFFFLSFQRGKGNKPQTVAHYNYTVSIKDSNDRSLNL